VEEEKCSLYNSINVKKNAAYFYLVLLAHRYQRSAL